MDEPKTRFDKLKFRIKNNRIMALILIIGTIIIALSTFTNAAKNLFGLINMQSRANINGEWIADVTYNTQNTTFVEFFTFKGEGNEVAGTATLYRLKRGIEEGKVKKDEIQFSIRTQEILSGEENRKDLIYRYRGKVAGDEIVFVLQIEGGFSTHIPIEFTAKRVVSSSFELKE